MITLIKRFGALVLLAGALGVASATTVHVRLSGAAEVPAVKSAASATAVISVLPDHAVRGELTTHGIRPTMVHIHARNPETGYATPSRRREDYDEVNHLVRQRCPGLIIDNTSGAGVSRDSVAVRINSLPTFFYDPLQQARWQHPDDNTYVFNLTETDLSAADAQATIQVTAADNVGNTNSGQSMW